ncbi:MAG: shikimate dehydrogenase [Candidatus Hermodarchaeota archaeon]
MPNRNLINSETKILGVIGHPISHSMSPIMHNTALQDLNLNYIYLAFDIKPENLKGAVKSIGALNIKGVNITIPHKEKTIQYLDELDELSKKIEAVNCIKNENGKLIGKNTDAQGARTALMESGFKLKNKKVIIIGAGGAAKAVSYSLGEELEQLLIFNRTKSRAIQLAKDLAEKVNIKVTGKELKEGLLRKELQSTDLLINTTPIGMYPNINASPIPLELIHDQLFVFDIIYNPLETKMIKYAKEVGCKFLGGLEMLVNQGALAFEWWTEKVPNKNLMKNIVKEYLVK